MTPAEPAPFVEAIAKSTTVGGYAQVQAGWRFVGPEPEGEGTATLRRLVLFVGHDFGHWGLPIRADVELEWENTVTTTGRPGSVEVEQAVLAWKLLGDTLIFRAGLVLVPMGVVNEHHDPPSLLGVDRPTFDQLVIPSTWRELGLGVSGAVGRLRYDLYALTPLDPTGFDDAGLVNGRTLGAAAPVDAAAFAGRVELEPRLGLVVGLSGYASDVGPTHDWYNASGTELSLSLPVLGAAVDARYKGHGFEARAVGALWSLPESDDLMEAYRADGSPYFLDGAAPVPTEMLGGYVELGWNVLYPADTEQELVPFARLEHSDTQRNVPEGTTANPLRTLDEGTFGLCWRPIPNLAFKADLQLRDRKYGDDEWALNTGIGWLY